MTVKVDEITADIFRISSFASDLDFTFNQYLVRDEQPLLYHTGFRGAFSATHEAVATLLDPATIRWIGYSHFEPDECGALNEWLAVAPNAAPVAGVVGSSVVLEDFSDRPAKALEDDQVLTTGGVLSGSSPRRICPMDGTPASCSRRRPALSFVPTCSSTQEMVQPSSKRTFSNRLAT